MKQLVASVLGVLLVVVVTIGLFSTLNSEPAESTAADATIGLPTITLPPITIKDVITLRPDPVTLPPVTVTLPGDRVTVTKDRTEYVTKTKTVSPRNTKTVTVRPTAPTQRVTERTTKNSKPGPTVTETVTTSPEHRSGPVDLGDDKVTFVEVGIGLLTIIVIGGIMVLLLYAGYIIGYKDEERKETQFMKSLLSQVKRKS